MADTQTLGKLLVETFFRDQGVKAGMLSTEKVVTSTNKSINGFLTIKTKVE